jgi:hypothetical protein
VEIGWAEVDEHTDRYRFSRQGRELYEQAERLTDEYFYAPWSILEQDEIDELYGLLTKLRDELGAYRKTKIPGDRHL